MRQRVSRALLWCLALSVVLHFTIGPLVVWLTRTAPPKPVSTEIIYVSTSSAVRISHRTHPRKPRLVTRVLPAPRQHAARAQQTRSAPAPREIARIDRRARTVERPKTTNQRTNVDSAQQQELFEKTIARLREANDPIIGAARPVQTPGAIKRYAFDFSGSTGTSPRGEGILSPLRSWHSQGYDYYYVRYWVQYPDGTTETGIVPWPLRYMPAADPFRLGLEHFPLPIPLPDYTLPPGTPLHPLVAYCYGHRDELASCPIYHG